MVRLFTSAFIFLPFYPDVRDFAIAQLLNYHFPNWELAFRNLFLHDKSDRDLASPPLQ